MLKCQKNLLNIAQSERLVETIFCLNTSIGNIEVCHSGVAIAGTSADAVKELDPSITTVSPPKIGDAVESVSLAAFLS